MNGGSFQACPVRHSHGAFHRVPAVLDSRSMPKKSPPPATSRDIEQLAELIGSHYDRTEQRIADLEQHMEHWKHDILHQFQYLFGDQPQVLARRGQGQAVLSSPQLNRSVVLSIRPAACRRRFSH